PLATWMGSSAIFFPSNFSYVMDMLLLVLFSTPATTVKLLALLQPDRIPASISRIISIPSFFIFPSSDQLLDHSMHLFCSFLYVLLQPPSIRSLFCHAC